MIYFRNNPSILFWEAGNTVIQPDQMQQMVDLRKQWDPAGGRVIGSRGNSDNAANAANNKIAEYYGSDDGPGHGGGNAEQPLGDVPRLLGRAA